MQQSYVSGKRHVREDKVAEVAREAAAVSIPNDHAKASECDQTPKIWEFDPAAVEAAAKTCSLPPLPANPPAISPTNFDIYMGGIIFSKEQVSRLCVDAWGISEAFVEHAGPLAAARKYFDTFLNLDCPSFEEIHFYDNDTNLPRRGCLFICRVAFVEQGYMQPRLLNDEKAQEFIDYWFPPHIRGSPAFAGVRGGTYKYDGSWMCTLAYPAETLLFCSRPILC